MATAKHNPTTTAPSLSQGMPGADEVHRSGQEISDVLKKARTQLHSQAQALHQQREQLELEREELAQRHAQLEAQCTEHEAVLADAAEMSSKIDDQRHEAQAAITRVEADKRELGKERAEFEKVHAKFVQEREAQSAQVVQLQDQQSATQAQAAEVELQIQALATQKAELDQHAQAISKKEQDLNTWNQELTQTQQTLSQMQSQLTQEQQLLAAQRETLLQQMQHTPRSTSAETIAPPAPVVPALVAPAQNTPRGPKSATSAAAEQFRKLRRDAKRKAIGV